MPLYVLDNTKLYEADLDNIIEADRGNTVVAGCSVAAHAAPDMGVRVASGTIHALGTAIGVFQTDLTITAANPSNTRIDLIHVDMTTGVPAIVDGTAGSLKPNSLPTNSILLGYVSVPAAAVNIQNANITQRQLTQSWRNPGGPRANRPAASYRGRMWYSNDVDQPELERDNGGSWDTITGRYPNLVLNSDFGRRTVFGLAMPEAFADLSAWVLEAGSGLGSVGSNIFTAGNTGAWRAKWNGPAGFFRDGRFTVAVKFEDDSGASYHLFGHYTDGNNYSYVRFSGGATDTFELRKNVGGVDTLVQSVAFNPTATIWYWMEIEYQGTTVIGKLWETGTAVAGTTVKTASTLRATVTGTIADAAIQSGVPSIGSTAATASKWGGFSASPGGLYFETWLPESHPITFTGTLGGQAIVYDDSAAAGPLGKAWALRGYIPATSRTISGIQPQGALPWQVPSVPHTISAYGKTSGFAGSGSLIYVEVNGMAAVQWAAADTTWTRKSATANTPASNTPIDWAFNISGTASGTAWLMLPQLEQGSVATAWRNAPADDAPIVWELKSSLSVAVTAVTQTEVDPRDAAINAFLPWDANGVCEHEGVVRNGVAGNLTLPDVSVDGATPDDGLAYVNAPVAGYNVSFCAKKRVALTAGKHRISATSRVNAGTSTHGDRATRLFVVASRGK